jgi:predicted RNA binding protein YcfA (HicA-like mRNA interferase family)
VGLRCAWTELRDVCARLGWREDRTRGDHLVMVKDGAFRPVVIKMERDLGDDIIASNCRTMGITRKKFEGLLAEIRGQKKSRRR